jgi:putative PIN family toxin of toxin-antitoxin system
VRVVFDTNVFVSAFVFPGGQGERAFLLASRRHVSLYTSLAILRETAHVLRDKFSQPDEDVRAALRRITRTAEVMRPITCVTILADRADNHILECALAAHADLVVTGDRPFLALKRFEGIAIVRLADFLRLFPPDDIPA